MAPPQGSQRPQQQVPPQVQPQFPGMAGGPPPGAAPPSVDPAVREMEERKRAASEGLPEGWAVAFDASKKPYFYHRVTKVGLAVPWRWAWLGVAACLLGLFVASMLRKRLCCATLGMCLLTCLLCLHPLCRKQCGRSRQQRRPSASSDNTLPLPDPLCAPDRKAGAPISCPARPAPLPSSLCHRTPNNALWNWNLNCVLQHLRISRTVLERR
jgi:hypothetical protein